MSDHDKSDLSVLMFSRQNVHPESSCEWLLDPWDWFNEATGFFSPEHSTPGWQSGRSAVPCCQHTHQRSAAALPKWQRGPAGKGWTF